MKSKSKDELKLDTTTEVEPLSEGEANEAIQNFYAELEKEYQDTPPEEIEASANRFRDFLKGEISWGEMLNFTPEMLYQLADYGYTQFKTGRYPDAERIFKVLTFLDWNNGYYHSLMGAVLQKQKRYAEAIAQYNEAIRLSDQDIVSYTNRGEIFLMHGVEDKAKEDFKRAIELDLTGKDGWANRAKLLLQEIEKKGKS